MRALHGHAQACLLVLSVQETVETIGYRGEFLFSLSQVFTTPDRVFNYSYIETESGIPQVSHVAIKTRHKDNDHGMLKIMGDGETGSCAKLREPVPVGTTVTVQDLFYNRTSRRKRFQFGSESKAESLELQKILTSVACLALANIDISFVVFSQRHQTASGAVLSCETRTNVSKSALMLARFCSLHSCSPLQFVTIDEAACSELRIDGLISIPPHGARMQQYANGRRKNLLRTVA